MRSRCGRQHIHAFRHQSVAGLVVLSTITLGIYVLIWLIRQIRIIRSVLPEKAIPESFVSRTAASFIMGYVGAIVKVGIDHVTDPIVRLGISLGISIEQVIASVLLIGCTFKVRNRLNAILGSGPAGFRFSVLGTLLGGIFYLQYKINRMQERIPQYGYCAACGFDLRDVTKPQCPYCGTAFIPSARGVRIAAVGSLEGDSSVR